MAGLCEGENEPAGSLKVICKWIVVPYTATPLPMHMYSAQPRLPNIISLFMIRMSKYSRFLILLTGREFDRGSVAVHTFVSNLKWLVKE
ncbi:hypothetical protein ANN_18811 [Periplaneta americana]|uniref:Uncharacterized protein n=1 Tax=Periplaneta americana TaxID=6978 RepID=A0ABQ8SPT6_PERAM|nr:hypothetical protein ANN_18811 [Periplaneta americana]